MKNNWMFWRIMGLTAAALFGASCSIFLYPNILGTVGVWLSGFFWVFTWMMRARMIEESKNGK